VVVALVGCGRAPALVPRARKPKVDLSLSSARVKVGEPVEVVTTVEHPDGLEALFPPIEAELGGLEVVAAGEVESHELEPGVAVTRRTTTLRGFRTGGYTVGPLEIRLKGASAAAGGSSASAAADTLVTPKARLEIYSVLANGTKLGDLRDEAGPFELPPEPAGWGSYIAIVLGIVALHAAGAFLLARVLARRAARMRSPPPPPAHLVALAELRAVQGSGLLDDGRLAEYTDRVSDILRRYLEARFALPAPERTTEEFLDEVARAPVLDRRRKQFLADYLAQCDLVKFAAREPGRRELDELYDSSVGFVEETARDGSGRQISEDTEVSSPRSRGRGRVGRRPA